MHRFANPARFLKIARPATGWLLGLGLLLSGIGIVGALALSRVLLARMKKSEGARS